MSNILSKLLSCFKSVKKVDDKLDFHYEEDRLKTYTNYKWPFQSCLSPEELANAGFYYLGFEDAVKCSWCGIKLKNFKGYMHPLESHRLASRDCVFANGRQCGNVPIRINVSEFELLCKTDSPNNNQNNKLE